MISNGINLHVYPAPIVGESRILRQTAAVEESNFFDEVVICGRQRKDLPSTEFLSKYRRIERLSSGSEQRSKTSFGRIFDQILWSTKLYRRWKNSPIRVVNAHSVAVLPVCAALAKKCNARLIYDTHELETETSTSKGPQRRLFKAIERKYIYRCDAVFVVNASIQNWYQEAYPGLDVTAIRNAPGHQPYDGPPVDFRSTFSINSNSRLYVHVGNLAHHRYIPEILETFAARKDFNEHVVFLGAGTLEKLVQEYANRYENIHLHEPIPSEVVVPTLASSDVGLCLIEPTCLSYALSLPNKAIEYTMAGLPFIYSDLVEVDQLLEESLTDWKVKDVPKALSAALDSISPRTMDEFRARLKQVELPVWERESGRMLTKYDQVLRIR
jgi:hypothetical protein